MVDAISQSSGAACPSHYYTQRVSAPPRPPDEVGIYPGGRVYKLGIRRYQQLNHKTDAGHHGGRAFVKNTAVVGKFNYGILYKLSVCD